MVDIDVRHAIRLVKSGLLSNTSLLIGAVVILVICADSFLTPRLDPDEPPLLKPTIPLIGHIIGIIRYQNDYHRKLRGKHPLPITSLQMLWGKIYAVWDPSLVQATLRARNASAEAFMFDFAEKMSGMDKATAAKMNEELLTTFMDATHGSMQGNYVHEMNVVGLNYISRTLDRICRGEGDGGVLTVPNLYLWFRDIITLATTHALLGKENPFEKDSSLLEPLWDYEEGLADIVFRPMPWLTARKAFLARGRLQDALTEFYEAQHDVKDPAVSQLTKVRARTLREHGFTAREVAMVDIILPVIGVTNTAPSMFWMFCYIFARPALLDRLRAELSPVVQRSQTSRTEDTAVVDINRLEENCPLLCACFRETLRLDAHNVSSRRIVKDTTITQSQGRSYTLKKGVDVQIALGISHYLTDVWGEDVNEFNPDRFLDEDGKGADGDKAKKNAFIPFGGGRHYCPGRSFAFAETLALASAFVIGFEATPVGKAFDEVEKAPPVFTTALLKPIKDGEGLGTKLKRREGWENVNWKFEG